MNPWLPFALKYFFGDTGYLNASRVDSQDIHQVARALGCAFDDRSPAAIETALRCVIVAVASETDTLVETQSELRNCKAWQR